MHSALLSLLYHPAPFCQPTERGIFCNQKGAGALSEVYARWAEKLKRMARTDGSGMGGWAFGDVLDAGQGRLKVVCLGLTLGPDELHLPPGLSYTWTEDEGQEGNLRAGDKLLVLVTADGQDYYVLQKAVFP